MPSEDRAMNGMQLLLAQISSRTSKDRTTLVDLHLS